VKIDKQKYADIILELSKEGAGEAEMAKALEVSKVRFRLNVQSDPYLQEIFDYGITIAQAWWEEMGRKGLTVKGFNTSLWQFNMKNKFYWDWKDRRETIVEMKEPTLPGWMDD